MKRALIVAATGGFLNGFLIPDMKIIINQIDIRNSRSRRLLMNRLPE